MNLKTKTLFHRISKIRFISLLVKVLGVPIEVFRTCAECSFDGYRHLRHGVSSDFFGGISNNRAALRVQISKDYHRIEKGLALGEPKQPFGDRVVDRLNRNIPLYRDLRQNSQLVSIAESRVSELQTWNERGIRNDGVSLKRPQSLDRRMDPAELENFFESRRSVRHFSNKPVPRETIDLALKCAVESPSVCNRQPWRVDVIDDPEKVIETLTYQNGNTGFRESVKTLLVISVDCSLFSGPGERNQRFIDGGIFSMSVVLALHAAGVSSCMLNWSRNNSHSQALRTYLSIPPRFEIMMMVATGFAHIDALVATSPRKPLESVRKWH